ncbi:zinc metalloproteinase nas-10-like [Ostrinia nubilalis]|uniref:zinc metalloproteinase nas-10-like n=1 Tax=Ostrinia nubilalis TaxID=29057 RepID=UPI0030826A6E
METFARLQKELCVKFFNTPTNFTATADNKVLYISNPDKKKDCPPIGYDFSKSVVDMPIGYRCINQKDIARITVDMLKASVIQNVSIYNSYDLVKRFHEMEDSVPRSALLPPTDRNYLNAHYHSECGSLGQASARRINDVPASAQLTDANIEYYKDKLWPLGVVMYGVDKDIPSNDSNLLRIKQAMSVIELNTCVMFQEISSEGVLEPRNFLWLSYQGEDMPQLGFKQGNQSLNIASLTQGAPGHAAHALAILLRALGVPMMSNRRDRDNHVAVDWRNVAHATSDPVTSVPARLETSDQSPTRD